MNAWTASLQARQKDASLKARGPTRARDLSFPAGQKPDREARATQSNEFLHD